MKKLIYLDGSREDPDVEHITFPTGERHIRIKNLCRPSDVTCGGQGLEFLTEGPNEIVIFYNDPSGEIMKLAMAVDICRRNSMAARLKLVMPFVPYARQDRIAAEGDPLSVEIFCRYINQFQFDKVFIVDPHSDVTSALLKNCVVIPQFEVAAQAVRWLDSNPLIKEEIAIVAPDLGAAKKAKALQAYLARMGDPVPTIIQCDKTRDVNTGEITGFKILDGDPEGLHCLMVDDICDGGGTFLGLHSVLAQAGAYEQSLFVTHGIFSKGTTRLRKVFAHVFCSDSFPNNQDVIVLPIGVQV